MNRFTFLVRITKETLDKIKTCQMKVRVNEIKLQYRNLENYQCMTRINEKSRMNRVSHLNP